MVSNITGKTMTALIGLSTDTKPTGYDNGSVFTEIDTGMVFIYDEQNKHWCNPSVDVASIAVTTPPSTTTYNVNDLFSTTGMVVTATYKDGESAAITGYSYAPTGGLKTTDTKIVITYQGKTCEQAITVTEEQNLPD